MIGFINGRSAEVVHRTRLETNNTSWFGPAPILIGMLVALSLWLVATSAALVLYAVLRPLPVPWLPEAVSLIGSVDTRIQRWAFLFTAIAFAAMLAAALLIRPAPPRWLRIAGGALCFSFDRALRLAALSRVLNLSPSRWFVRVVLLVCLVVALAIFTWGQIKLSSYDGTNLLQVQAGDPHIYAIFGEAGETLVGRFSPNASETNLYAYGFGPAAIYAVGRHIGATGSYFYAYQIARWSNLFAVLVLLGALFQPQFSRLGYFPTALILAAAAFIAIPLLFPNSYSAFAANLSGLRYVPMMLFIVGVGALPKRTTWGTKGSIALAVFASLGLVYSVDIGIVSLVAYITFIGLEEGSISNRILQVFVFLGGTAVSVVIIGVIVRETLSVDFFNIAMRVASAAGNDFGGLIVQFSLRDILIASLFVVTASALVFGSIDRALDSEERFVAAIAIMGFVWYSYYLRRPWDGYWIFAYLALFNLRYWLGRTSEWGTAACRVGAIGAFAATAMLVQQSYPGLKLGIDLERASRHNADLKPISMLSGIRVAASFGNTMTARINLLDQLSTPDSVVVTGFPYLVSTASNVANPPHDIVFSMMTTQKIDVFVSLVLTQRPSRVLLEPTDTPAWGPVLMHSVVNRIEKGISGQYKRDEAVNEWRVWNLKAQ